MKQHFITYLSVFLLVAATASLFGCHENVLINSSVSPSANAIGVYSVSLPVVTHTFYSDSAVTSTNIGGIGMYQAVGSIYDPFFGTMSGATYFQVIPPEFSQTLLDTTVNTFDSAILVLPYSGFTYGDTLNTNYTQTCQVFLMTDTLGDPVNSIYYSASSKSTDLNYPLSAPYTYNVYHLRDSVGINLYDQNYPGLRIPLKLPLIYKYLNNAMTSINTASTTLAQDFEGIFKGVCVRMADSRQMANALPYFVLNGTTDYSTAGIFLYYHPYGAALPMADDSDYYFDFDFNTQFCAHFNSINRSYSHYPVSGLLHSTSVNDSIVVLQNQPGTNIDVIIPGISHLPAGVINKAELQLTLLPAYNSIYGTDTLQPPFQLYPTGITSATYPPSSPQLLAGVAYNVADRYPLYSTSPLLVMDGFLHNINGASANTYTIDIPREVMQSIAAKNDTIHLHVSGSSDFYGAFHLIAGGGSYGRNGTSDTAYRAKFVVTYSQLAKH